MEINVRECGALGNGRADDTEAIRKAVATAGDGDTVFFPAGTYCVQVTHLEPPPDPARCPGECCLIPDVDFADYPGASVAGYRQQTQPEQKAFSLPSSGVTLAGEGPSSRISCVAEREGTRRTDVERAWLFSIDGKERITFRQLAMESTGTLRNAFDYAIWVGGSPATPARQITVEECAFSGFREAAFASRGGRAGEHPAILSDLRITECDIRNIGRMKDDHPGRSACWWSANDKGEEFIHCETVRNCMDYRCRVVFGVGINANGWDRVYIAHNRIENVGSMGWDWGIYCVETRDAIVAENTIIDCSGGIAWSGIDALAGHENVTVIGNTIDLAREVDGPLNLDEERFSGDRVGLQLRGNHANTPVQAHAINNQLRYCNIQCSTQNAVIAGNEVDLENLRGQGGIWAGWFTWEARNVVVSANRVRATSAGTIDTTGIIASTGSGIRIVGNRVDGATRGIALGVDHVTAASGGVKETLITHNVIATANGRAFVHINGANDVEVAENICVAAGTIPRGIQIGDAGVPSDNRNIRVHHNHLLGEPGSGIAFGLTKPGAEEMPRNILIEENLADFRIVELTANCPPDSGYTVFKDGDILRGNALTPGGLGWARGAPNECERSERLLGAVNAERALRALQLDGWPAYSVLGGEEFWVPLDPPCTWTKYDPAAATPCAVAEPYDPHRIAFLSYGFAGQEITLHARGKVTIVDVAAPEGNIRLAGVASLPLHDGDWVRLQRGDDGTWTVLRSSVAA